MTDSALPPLDQPCQHCDATGKVGVMRGPSAWSSGAECPECRGLKVVPTATGQAILNFLRKHRG